MTISFDFLRDIEQEVSADGADLNDEAREVFLVELYRRDKISQHQLGMALGADDPETDDILKQHGVVLEITIDELRAEADSFQKAASR